MISRDCVMFQLKVNSDVRLFLAEKYRKSAEQLVK